VGFFCPIKTICLFLGKIAFFPKAPHEKNAVFDFWEKIFFFLETRVGRGLPVCLFLRGVFCLPCEAVLVLRTNLAVGIAMHFADFACDSCAGFFPGFWEKNFFCGIFFCGRGKTKAPGIVEREFIR
jgi:hypothetical protein